MHGIKDPVECPSGRGSFRRRDKEFHSEQALSALCGSWDFNHKLVRCNEGEDGAVEERGWVKVFDETVGCSDNRSRKVVMGAFGIEDRFYANNGHFT